MFSVEEIILRCSDTLPCSRELQFIYFGYVKISRLRIYLLKYHLIH